MKLISIGLSILSAVSFAAGTLEWRAGATKRDVRLMMVIAGLLGVAAVVGMAAF